MSGSGFVYTGGVFLAAWLERLGLGGREMTASGHSKNFVLRVVQPSLVGLMDGSVSTLAPLFATAFATRDPRITFLVGLAAAVGAGISMGFSEGLSDDGSLTGRGSPFLRGTITGLATFAGGILHTPPFLIPHVNLALYVAFGVVAFGIFECRHAAPRMLGDTHGNVDSLVLEIVERLFQAPLGLEGNDGTAL